jgi:hypothetical protein
VKWFLRERTKDERKVAMGWVEMRMNARECRISWEEGEERKLKQKKRRKGNETQTTKKKKERINFLDYRLSAIKLSLMLEKGKRKKKKEKIVSLTSFVAPSPPLQQVLKRTKVWRHDWNIPQYLSTMPHHFFFFNLYACKCVFTFLLSFLLQKDWSPVLFLFSFENCSLTSWKKNSSRTIFRISNK